MKGTSKSFVRADVHRRGHLPTREFAHLDPASWLDRRRHGESRSHVEGLFAHAVLRERRARDLHTLRLENAEDLGERAVEQIRDLVARHPGADHSGRLRRPGFDGDVIRHGSTVPQDVMPAPAGHATAHCRRQHD